MDRDSGKYENVGVSQYQSINNPNFGQGITVSKMRYVSNNSNASPRPSTSHVVTSPTNRGSGVRYVTIDSQLENDGNVYTTPQNYVNPFNEQRETQSSLLENQGVKRVTSYTHFVNQPGSATYQQTSVTPTAAHMTQGSSGQPMYQSPSYQ